MRVNRAKFIRKYLKFFRIVFNIKTPYNVILDGNFIFQAIKYKVDIVERLTKLLQCDEVKIFTQKSIFDELKAVGGKAVAALAFAEKYCVICDDSGIFGETPAARLICMLENLHQTASENPKQMKYIVATQDKELRVQLGSIPGVPLVYFNKVTLVLEPPSETSKKFSQKLEHNKISPKESETRILDQLVTINSNIIGGNDLKLASDVATVAVPAARLKRKALSANPLSSRPPSADSSNSKRRKVQKFKR